jgi:hypothetical protein
MLRVHGRESFAQDGISAEGFAGELPSGEAHGFFFGGLFGWAGGCGTLFFFGESLCLELEVFFLGVPRPEIRRWMSKIPSCGALAVSGTVFLSVDMLSPIISTVGFVARFSDCTTPFELAQRTTVLNSGSFQA